MKKDSQGFYSFMGFFFFAAEMNVGRDGTNTVTAIPHSEALCSNVLETSVCRLICYINIRVACMDT